MARRKGRRGLSGRRDFIKKRVLRLGLEPPTMTNPRVIEVNGVTIECRVDDALAPAALRAFAGATPLDAYVDALPVPKGGIWLAGMIWGLRWYRARVSPALGQRCVFEPSCSRYAELALRQKRLAEAIFAILHRLRRCRPGRGGIDLP